MKAKQMLVFGNGVAAGVALVGANDFLEVENGLIKIPEGAKPKGIHLAVAIKKGARSLAVQRNRRKLGGDYGHGALSSVNLIDGFDTTMMVEPIEVCSAGGNVWTNSKSDRPNLIDIWSIDEDGKVTLFQPSVVTHDDGITWHLLGEYAWKGQLFRLNGVLVGMPDDPVYGSFDVRRTILENQEFMALVKSAKIREWKGAMTLLDPMMGPIDVGQARIKWYKVTGGQKGQGIAVLDDGTDAWILGDDLLVEPDDDGIKRPGGFNTLISFSGIGQFGSGRSKRLMGVKLAQNK